jgi:hypothetical protein
VPIDIDADLIDPNYWRLKMTNGGVKFQCNSQKMAVVEDDVAGPAA